MKPLTEQTLIPIGVAVVVIGGGAMWVNDITSKVKINREIVDHLQATSDATQKLIYEVNSRLARLEWKLEEESEKLSRRK